MFCMRPFFCFVFLFVTHLSLVVSVRRLFVFFLDVYLRLFDLMVTVCFLFHACCLCLFFLFFGLISI